MPVLKDPKHEAFAQALAKGQAADKAYAEAGYRPHRGNASTLRAKQNIQDRVTELQAQTAEKLVDTSVFEARSMFLAILQDIEDAKKAGDYKTAADLRKFFVSCFGYEDSPTLTHEHVKNTKLETADKPAGEEVAAQPDRSNVVMLARAIKKAQSRAG